MIMSEKKWQLAHDLGNAIFGSKLRSTHVVPILREIAAILTKSECPLWRQGESVAEWRQWALSGQFISRLADVAF